MTCITWRVRRTQTAYRAVPRMDWAAPGASCIAWSVVPVYCHRGGMRRKKNECEALGMTALQWHDLHAAVESTDITEQYGDSRFPVQLRMFTGIVYGRAPDRTNDGCHRGDEYGVEWLRTRESMRQRRACGAAAQAEGTQWRPPGVPGSECVSIVLVKV